MIGISLRPLVPRYKPRKTQRGERTIALGDGSVAILLDEKRTAFENYDHEAVDHLQMNMNGCMPRSEAVSFPARGRSTRCRCVDAAAIESLA